ncbi:MAG TPA: signal peptidase I [Candidatus Limnocylindria bacterium]|nr:signal peptidase I [Candidatus Limnocylindria bacterium]
MLTVSSLNWMRRVVLGLWLLGAAALVAVILLTRLATTVVIVGGSMEPGIQLGSLVVLEHVDAGGVHAGDVLTIRADNGVLITHRVARVVASRGTTYVELQGDANPSPDPTLVESSSIVGRVSVVLPVAGYVVAMAATPIGLLSLLAGLGLLLVASWLLEELAEPLVERDPEAIPGGLAA